jgi:hypothetical protein
VDFSSIKTYLLNKNIDIRLMGVLDNINWSNTDFAKNAKKYGFTANQGWGLKGINNLEPGDIIQYKQSVNAQGKYYPSHSRILMLLLISFWM